MARKKLLLAATLGLGVILFAALLWRGNVEEASQLTGPPERRVQPPGAEPPAGGAGTTPSAPAATNRPDGEVANLLAKLSPKQLRYLDFGFNAGMEDVALYAQLVDQHGAPVVQAEIWYCVGGRYLNAGPGCGTKRTDSEGRFAILSRGASVSIKSIMHPEIEMQFPEREMLPPGRGKAGLSDFGESEVDFYGYQRYEGGNDLLWTDTSPEKPHVFKAWRFGVLEPVRVGGTRRGRLNPDGRLYTFDLLRERPHHKALEGVLDGQFMVSCQRDPQIFDKAELKKQREEMTWTVTITPIDGGIQPSDDIYMNVAPESGYQPAIVFDSQTAISHSRSPGFLGEKRFFFTAKSGQVYGAMMVRIDVAADTDYCSVDVVKFKLNNQGSRNLAARRPGQ